ncbi:hypothetical protein AV274_0015 [Blastocystis sp. ATCC 50177/Nand II]|uniref:mRNA m(6)A methyltransferase n=1 Tax=Blastocystis sp. subtype 1 (strain ATCC 50177 / NandII) TaxID=478820 RepID=A0A196SMF4_BLAHN|nr:hypothetical protein AV274_0015 [Blastocystis sp. ATCC 50177/Nand II]
MSPGRVQRSYSSTTRYGRAGFLHLQWKRKRSNGVLQQLPNVVPLLMYRDSGRGSRPCNRFHLRVLLLRGSQGNKEDEEEYILEEDESLQRKRNRSERHHAMSSSSIADSFGGAVEEMNERSVMKAICCIEQKLLLSDVSPSIHNTVDEAKNDSKQRDNDFSTVLSSYSELKALRNELQKKGLLHRLIKLREMTSLKPVAAGEDGNMDDLDDEMKACVTELSQYDPPPLSIPINADIRTFDWEKLGQTQFATTGRYFDVIMMDPPWQLATANPTRGVAIAYEQLGDDTISAIPVAKIQTDGYLFMWVINAKYRLAIEMISYWGYVRRRDRVGEVQPQPAHGEEPRLLPAALQGDLLRGEARQPAATDQLRAGVGRDLLRAPGPEPEAHRYIRAHRAVGAEVLPGDLRAQEQPSKQLGHGGERAMTVF